MQGQPPSEERGSVSQTGAWGSGPGAQFPWERSQVCSSRRTSQPPSCGLSPAPGPPPLPPPAASTTSVGLPVCAMFAFPSGMSPPEDECRIWPGTSVAPAPSTVLIEPRLLGGPGAGCGDTGGNQTDRSLSPGAGSNTQACLSAPIWVCTEGERMAGEDPPRSLHPFKHQVSVLASGSLYPALFGGERGPFAI